MTTLFPRLTTRSIELRVGNLIDSLVDPSTEPERDRAPLKPLPLADVLKNLTALHAACHETHVCGLPRSLQRFDLSDYLNLCHGRNGTALTRLAQEGVA